MSTSYHALKSTSIIPAFTSLEGSTGGDAPGLKRVGVYAVMGFIMFISPTLFGKYAPDSAPAETLPPAALSSLRRNGKTQHFGGKPTNNAATNLKLRTNAYICKHIDRAVIN